MDRRAAEAAGFLGIGAHDAPLLGFMDKGIFHFIWRYSARDQLALIMLSVIALPVLYFTFDLPKTIVNRAIGGDGGFPKEIMGHSLEQIPYLLVLCGAFLGLVLVNLAFKYMTSTYRYRVGDRLLRRMRFDLVERLMRFPPREFRNTSSGQVVSMVTAETSPLGFFIAEAFAVPAVALGTLLTIVLFMFMQDWMMGLAAISLLPAQLYLIPKFQQRINTLQRDEVNAVRQISQRVGDVVAGVGEIHGHDTSQYELADFSKRLGGVFKTRVEISSNRYIVNILNTFFSQLTPFFFLSIGGYLVIKGDISLGALVAVLAAYKDMYAPYKDLIDYYQKAADARVKFDQLKEFFEPPGLLDRTLLSADAPPVAFDAGTLSVSNLVVESDDGVRAVDGVTLSLPLPVHAIIVGGGGSGAEELALALARQVLPSAGRLAAADLNLPELPDSATGRKIGYVGPQTYFHAGTLHEALIYPLLHRPNVSKNAEDPELKEAVRAGNSAYDPDADWIDYAAAGCTGPQDLAARIIDVLRIVGLDRDVYEVGLRRAIDPAAQPDLAERLVAARVAFRARVEKDNLGGLIEPFDADKYLKNASVAENILFGTPVGPYFALENLGRNAFMLRVIEEVGLTDEFLERGRKLAATMLDIFRDLPPGHEFFDRFSFIKGEDLPEFEGILRRADAQGLSNLDADGRALLLSLPFKLIVNQHHVGLIDAKMQSRLLHARKVFARTLPDDLRGAVQFFDATAYNAASSIADNLIFGKIATNRADSAPAIGALLTEVLDELDLRADVVAAGLGLDIGVGAARLSVQQRQKLALARAVLKRPDILILNDAFAGLDPSEQEPIFARLKGAFAEKSVILVEPTDRRAALFEHVVHMERGKIVSAQGRAAAHAPGESAPADMEVGLNDVVAIFQRIPMFAGIDRSKLKLLAFTSDHATFQEGQYVFRQGDRGDNAYVIIEGEVEVVLESLSGPRVLAVLGANQVFGEMALLSKVPRTTSIRARSASRMVVIASDVFLRLVEENSAIAGNMMRTLANRLATMLQDYGKVSASHDLTTNLPTRRVFLEHAAQAQARRKRHGKDTAIMVFSLASLSAAVMKIARDDIPSVMRQAAQRMRRCVRGSDVLAHLHDSQYGVILTDYAGEEDAKKAAGRIATSLAEPFKVGAEMVRIPVDLEFRLAALDEDTAAETLEKCWTDDVTRFVLAS